MKSPGGKSVTALAVDMAVFGLRSEGLHLLLIERKHAPHAGRWALPGGFVESNEDALDAARRELKEETGLEKVSLHQFQAFTAPNRDPRGRVVSIGYFGAVWMEQAIPSAASDAAKATWFRMGKLPAMAFDHGEIAKCAREGLRDRWLRELPSRELIGNAFTLRELRRAYEIVLEVRISARRLSNALLAKGLIRPLARQVPNQAVRYRQNRPSGRRALNLPDWALPSRTGMKSSPPRNSL